MQLKNIILKHPELTKGYSAKADEKLGFRNTENTLERMGELRMERVPFWGYILQEEKPFPIHFR